MTPEGWRAIRLGDAATVIGGGTPSRENASFWDGHIPWATPTDVTSLAGRYIERTASKISAAGLAASSAKLLPAGSVLMTSRATIGRCAISRVEMATNQGFQNLVPGTDVDAPFLAYVIGLRVPELVSLAAGSTFLEVSRRSVASLTLALPPLAEQRKIAAILSSLDDAIEATQAVIDQLQVVKKAMMADLLTRGLPGRHTRFKMTEIGEVPEEWEVVALGALASFVTSGSRGWAEYYANEGALFLRSQNVRAGFVDLTERAFVKPPTGAEGARTKLEQHDILVTITGNSVGNVAVAPGDLGEAYVSQHVGLVRLREPALASYCALFLAPGSPGNEQLLAAQYGQSKPGLNLKNLREFRIGVPPVAEMKQIESAIQAVQQRVEAESSSVDALRQAKSALMSVLLTGEVRVTPDKEDA